MNFFVQRRFLYATPPQLTTEQLIKGLKRGKRNALNFLYQEYSGLFFTIASRYARSSQEAEDFTQEAFLKIFSNVRDFKGNGSFEGWMKRIVVNTCLNGIRGQNVFNETQELEVEVHESAYKQEAEALESMGADQVMKCIEQLPIGFRTVFNLVVIEGYSHKEVAAELNITESASRSQLTKARMKLKTAIEALNTLVL